MPCKGPRPVSERGEEEADVKNGWGRGVEGQDEDKSHPLIANVDNPNPQPRSDKTFLMCIHTYIRVYTQ